MGDYSRDGGNAVHYVYQRCAESVYVDQILYRKMHRKIVLSLKIVRKILGNCWISRIPTEAETKLFKF